MIKAFCDWCGSEVTTKALKANEPHAPARSEELVLPGVNLASKVKVEVKVTAGDGQHICGRCAARAIAQGSDYLEGPEMPPYDVTGEPVADAEGEGAADD